MRGVLLAYNKLSSLTVESVFEELARCYRENRKEANAALIRLITTADISCNLLAIASMLKLVHSVLDGKTVRKVITTMQSSSNRESIRLFCYLYNYALIDDSFIAEILADRLSKAARGENAFGHLTDVLIVLQSSSSLFSKELLQNLHQNLTDIEKTSDLFICTFLKESVDSLLTRTNPFRDILKEEIASMSDTLGAVIGKHTHKPAETLTTTQGPAQSIASKYGMNTALKKRVFNILVTSKDYATAQTLLYKETLKVNQFSEVFFLLSYLCTQEARYNKYYAELAVSLVSTASKNHRNPFKKYIYAATEKYTAQIAKIPTKEIYNLGVYLSELIMSKTISAKFLSTFSYAVKKEAVFARIIFKSLCEGCKSRRIKGLKPIKETDTLKSFFNHRLIDGSFLTEEHSTLLGQIYRELVRSIKE
ncbi:hypothetical protein NEDG_01748 [Nematocida displodere]|uniref:MI domain-containing protein n=1 Tax=Nematocida displodere TaxID=1805483 RepID=A0A177EDY7_9MICR|nr:hypothetical protein NEDG_01748 [Nematocida displodere]